MQAHYRTSRRSGISVGPVGLLIVVPFILAGIYLGALVAIAAFLVLAVINGVRKPHRSQGLVLAILALAAAASVGISTANASTVQTYSLGHAKTCKVHYVKRTERHVINGRETKYIACIRMPIFTPPFHTATAVAPTGARRAHLDPIYTQDPSNPLKVTFYYWATSNDGPLPDGLISFYWGSSEQAQTFAKSSAVGAGVGDSQADALQTTITFPDYGTEYVTTIYTSGPNSATQTDKEDIKNPNPTPVSSPIIVTPIIQMPPVTEESEGLITPTISSTFDHVHTTTTTFSDWIDTTLPVPADETAALGTATITVTSVNPYYPQGSYTMTTAITSCTVAVYFDAPFSCSTTANLPALPWNIKIAYTGATYAAADTSTVLLDPETTKWQYVLINNWGTMVAQ